MGYVNRLDLRTFVADLKKLTLISDLESKNVKVQNISSLEK